MVTMLVILAAVVAIIVFLIFWLLVGPGRRPEMIRRRMEAVDRAERRGDISLGVKVVRDEMLSTVPVLHRLLVKWAWPGHLRDYLAQAGLHLKPGKLLLMIGVLGTGTYLTSKWLGARFLVSALLAVGIAVIPIIFIAWKRRRRLRRFEEHFPEALDLLSRAVRAGHAFTTGLEMIAQEVAEPIAGEFRTTFEEQNFGLPLRDALLNLSERVPLIDVRFFVTSLLIQKETGGNLSEILDGLARVIRDRFRIYREVQVKTAQGRLTAAILIGLPPFMMLVLWVMNPHYLGPLLNDPVGPSALAVAGILQSIGSMIIWKVIHFEV
jgi:tight adherence protein B